MGMNSLYVLYKIDCDGVAAICRQWVESNNSVGLYICLLLAVKRVSNGKGKVVPYRFR